MSGFVGIVQTAQQADGLAARGDFGAAIPLFGKSVMLLQPQLVKLGRQGAMKLAAPIKNLLDKCLLGIANCHLQISIASPRKPGALGHTKEAIAISSTVIRSSSMALAQAYIIRGHAFFVEGALERAQRDLDLAKALVEAIPELKKSKNVQASLLIIEYQVHTDSRIYPI